MGLEKDLLGPNWKKLCSLCKACEPNVTLKMIARMKRTHSDGSEGLKVGVREAVGPSESLGQVSSQGAGKLGFIALSVLYIGVH